MEFDKLKILNKIKKLKSEKYESFVLPGKFNGTDYGLVFLTNDCASDQHLMDLIGKWRKENEIWFSAKFEVTVERTTKWFKERLMDASDRLLFMIKVGNEYIGHVGLFRFDFENKTCEIDNIMRGQPGYPGIMQDAIKNMMDWGKKEFGLHGYSLQTASNNERAMNLYKKLGFTEISREPMVQIKGKEGPEWVKAPPKYDGEIIRYNVIMKL